MWKNSSIIVENKENNMNRNVDDLGNYILGGSDANRLMRGEWVDLFNEITGKTEPVDLSKVLQVQVGVATEKVNLDFLQYDLEEEVLRNVDVKPVEEMPFIRSSLDGMTHDTQRPCEAKHTYQDNRMEVLAENYYPQLQHYMMHSKVDTIYLSAIFGNRRFEYTSIDADYTYQKKLYSVEEWFIEHLNKNKEPKAYKGLPTIDKKDIKLDGMKQYDMKNNIKWKDFVQQYKDNKPYVEQFENCKKAIKGLVPDDCYRATGDGVVVTRNKRNILTIKEENKDGK